MSGIERSFLLRALPGLIRRSRIGPGLASAAVRLVTVAAVVGGMAGMLAAPASADWVRNDQWQVKTLDVRGAWRLATGEGVTVAVIDSGVDASHPDLAGQVLPGADFVDGSTDGRSDPVGHGTTIAGLIAGRGDDTNGVVGIAPKAKILPVRVLDKNNRYDDPAVVAHGIRWAVDHGATVINLSLGGQLRSDALADAVHYAVSHDVVMIACTGNIVAGSTSHEVWYPAREAGVVAVAGLVGPAASGGSPAPTASPGAGGAGGASTESLWSGSLTGPQTTLTAPAVNLLGAKPGGYWHVQGTSFAAPLVAGSAALVRSRFPELTAANVINRLIRTARDLGPTGRDDRYGYGEVDPVAALHADLAPVTTNPLGMPGMTAGSTDDGTPPASGAAEPSNAGAAPPEGASTTAQRSDAAADGTGVGVATRAVSAHQRLEASLALGGAVATLLFLLGLAVSMRRQHR